MNKPATGAKVTATLSLSDSHWKMMVNADMSTLKVNWK